MTRRKVGLTRHAPSEFGTIRQRGARWQAFWRADGATHRAPRTFDTRAAARAWLADQERALRGGTWIAPGHAADSLAAFAEDWLSLRGDLAPRTVEFYRGALDRFIVPNLGDVALASLTPARVTAWRADCLREAAERAAKGVSGPGNPARSWAVEQGMRVAATGRLPRAVTEAWEAAGSPLPRSAARYGDGSAAVAAAYRVLKTILNAAERDDLIAKNPCRDRGAGHLRAKERSPATPEQVDALAEAMPHRFRAAVVLAAWSGLRSGELRALARRHVDLEAGTVRVERSVVEVAGMPPTIGPTKTARSRRVVVLPSFVVQVLRQHMEDVEASPDSLIFATESGGVVTRHWLGAMFRRVRARIGLPALRWHDLRHTGASLAYAAGGSVVDVQRRLGHTTMRAAQIYAHGFEHADRALADRLNAAFGPGTAAQVAHGAEA